MIVMKFGGSSVADSLRVRHAAQIIRSYESERPVVVLSAMGDTTDFLLEAAEEAVSGVSGGSGLAKVESLHVRALEELGVASEEASEVKELLLQLRTLLTGIGMLRELTRRTRDYVLSFGERLSVRVMSAYLNKEGIPSCALDAWDAGLVSDSNYNSAELLDDVWRLIPASLDDYAKGRSRAIPIVTGFIAKDKRGIITTLGRGGSDLTATMIGSAMRVKEIQTWKDVDGILTADPKIVKSARLVPEVTYEEAEELAVFGSQVLHPRSMIPCKKTGTLVRVKNSYNTESAGSIIAAEHSGARPSVTAITTMRNITVVDIVSAGMLGACGFLAHIFNQFLKWNVSIDVIATSVVSVSLTVSSDADLSGLLEDLKNVADVTVKHGKAIVAVICDVANSAKTLALTFKSLSEAKINVQMISQGASKVNISMLVDDSEAEKTVAVLHSAYFEE